MSNSRAKLTIFKYNRRCLHNFQSTEKRGKRKGVQKLFRPSRERHLIWSNKPSPSKKSNWAMIVGPYQDSPLVPDLPQLKLNIISGGWALSHPLPCMPQDRSWAEEPDPAQPKRPEQASISLAVLHSSIYFYGPLIWVIWVMWISSESSHKALVTSKIWNNVYITEAALRLLLHVIHEKLALLFTICLQQDREKHWKLWMHWHHAGETDSNHLHDLDHKEKENFCWILLWIRITHSCLVIVILLIKKT